MCARRSIRCRRSSRTRSKTSRSSFATSIPRIPISSGLYEGTPLPERSSAAAGHLPDQITIYRLPLEESFPDPDELEEEIRITVLHELAHYFGIDEDRLDQLGYG